MFIYIYIYRILCTVKDLYKLDFFQYNCAIYALNNSQFSLKLLYLEVNYICTMLFIYILNFNQH